MAPPRPKSFDSKWAIAQSCNPLAVARVVAVPKAMSRAASMRWYEIASLTKIASLRSSVEQTPLPSLRRVIKLRSDEHPRPGSARADASHVAGPDAPHLAQRKAPVVLRRGQFCSVSTVPRGRADGGSRGVRDRGRTGGGGGWHVR